MRQGLIPGRHGRPAHPRPTLRSWPSLPAGTICALLLAALLGNACAGKSYQGRPTESPAEHGIVLWQPCDPARAAALEATAATDGPAALRAAACLASLLRLDDQGPKKELARRGLAQAKAATVALPQSALAHYLAAFLYGMEAEQNPLKGLDLVPLIEQEALLAAELDPRIDFGGPDRILGELYLRAPAFPMSVGDSSRAVERYRRAAAQAPAFVENRLGLAEALFADGDAARACAELAALLRDPGAGLDSAARTKALELKGRRCPGLAGN